MTVVGFTGTRDGCSNRQLAWLVRALGPENYAPGTLTIHHGACVGADAAVHAQAVEYGHHVEVWPPTKRNYLAVECVSPHPLVTVHPAKPYLDRDREIDRAAEVLVALPKQNEQPDRLYWGGTWYTVDFMERLLKPVTIVYPNGAVEQRFPDRPMMYDTTGV